MLWMIGLGLQDGKDITVRGKEVVSRAKLVFLEGYTSILQQSHSQLEKDLGVQIELLSRKDVEQDAERIIDAAKSDEVVFLVIGDPFGATTHADLYLRAKSAGVEVGVIHNASILNAVGCVGLELYKYGRTVSIPYWEQGYRPTSFLEGIKQNFSRGLHTLCLLDIKAQKKRFMSVQEGIEHLKNAQESVKEESLFHEGTPAIGVARIGCDDQMIVAGTLGSLQEVDFGTPPHAIIIPSNLHPVEEEMIELWSSQV